MLVAITVAGILFCVPETGPLQSIVGAIVPAALFGFVVARPARAFAVAPLVGLLVLTIIDGGETRPGAVIGGMACFGLLLLPPIVARRSWWIVVPGRRGDGRLHRPGARARRRLAQRAVLVGDGATRSRS